MRSRISAVITSWPFLLSLGLLLLNDLVLKVVYPGLVTGKLSDFAGIAVMSLLLLAAYPSRVMLVCGGMAIVFLWWKSPASADFIHLVRVLGYDDFGRTVDYSDLIALTFLPISSALVKSIDSFAIRWRQYRRILVVPIAAVTMLALTGTSMVQTRQEYLMRDMSSAK